MRTEGWALSPAIDSSVGQGGREFPATRWTQLLALRDPGHPAYRETLEELVTQYWKPAYHYARALRRDRAGDAQDLTQAFFVMLLERRDLERLSPERGSFRGFLKTALKHFLASDDRARAARSPRGDARLLRFDGAEEEWIQAARTQPELAPDEAFDREWARGILKEAVERLRQDLAAEGKQLVFDLFRDYCLTPQQTAVAPSYAQLAARHGIRETDVTNFLHSARCRLRDLIGERIRDYVIPGVSVEEELNYLLSR